MDEYISRKDALSAQNKSMNLNEMRKRLERLPAADVRPVVLCGVCELHGHCYAEDVFSFARLAEENRFCSIGKKREENRFCSVGKKRGEN